MLIAQFFGHQASATSEPFVLDSDLEGHGFYSDDFDGAAGEFAARDLRGNTGTLRVRKFDPPHDCETVIEAFTGGEPLNLGLLAKWLLQSPDLTSDEARAVIGEARGLLSACHAPALSL